VLEEVKKLPFAALSDSERHWFYKRSVGRIEVLLFGPATRTDPVLRQIGEGGSRRDVMFGIAFGRVIHVTAGAFHFLHGVSPLFKVGEQYPALWGRMPYTAAPWLPTTRMIFIPSDMHKKKLQFRQKAPDSRIGRVVYCFPAEFSVIIP